MKPSAQYILRLVFVLELKMQLPCVVEVTSERVDPRGDGVVMDGPVEQLGRGFPKIAHHLIKLWPLLVPGIPAEGGGGGHVIGT